MVVLKDGQYFGEWGVIEDLPRKASAIAVEDTDIFIIDKKTFNNSIGVIITLLRNAWLKQSKKSNHLYVK